MELAPSPEDQRHCLTLARAVLEHAFDSSVPLPALTPFTQQKLPCFVTLHTPGHRLRGCIGCTTTEDSLFDNIKRLTWAAAFEDPRFRPVDQSEVEKLMLEISILGPLQPVKDWSKIQIGKHGLKVSGKGRQGLLLAQVAAEQGWDVAEFKEETCVKAGLDPAAADHFDFSYFEQIEFQEAISIISP